MPLVIPGHMNPPGSKPSEEKAGNENPQAQCHSANPGPVIPENTKVFENTPSRKEQDAKMRALNK